MKKILVALASALLFSAALTAQIQPLRVSFDDDAVLALGSKSTSVEAFSYISFGKDLFEDDFTPEMNKFKDFTLNLVEFRFRPYETGQLSIGIDYERSMYRLEQYYFWGCGPDGGTVFPVHVMDSEFTKIKKSKLIVNSLSFPVSFEQAVGKWSLRFGVAGELNRNGRTKLKAVTKEGETVKYVSKEPYGYNNIKTNRFTYSFMAAISYGGFGFYMRYRPTYQFEPDCGPEIKTLTMGVIVGLGM